VKREMTQLEPTRIDDGPIPSTSAVESSVWRSAVLRTVALGVAQVVVTGASLYFYLGGGRRDWRVPLHFSLDSLIALMQSKSTFDNGWWWFNPMLGAPFGLDSVAFPMNGNVDQAIVWLTSWFVNDAVATTNIAWAVMVVLSGLSASWCMRRVGASSMSSMIAGTLFALSPYALYRHIGHIWMVTYLVPSACAAALLLWSGRFGERGLRKGRIGVLLGCALLGLNYIYYAFFGCFFILVASLARVATSRDWRVLRTGALCVGLIVGCTVLNLAPTLVTWNRHGKPIILHDKAPAESEMYGLKIRHLISPAYQHAFPPFGWWQRKEALAQFPLETENMGSRLGFVGTLGFLGLLCLLFVPQAVDRLAQRDTWLAASRLTLAAVLVATIGGFGSLFSLLITPEIRAWNRITPFIAFFSLTAVALALDALSRKRTLAAALAALVMLTIGLADQRMATIPLNEEYAQVAPEMPLLRTVVGELERRLPEHTMVLQLPFRTYLYDYGVARMKPYEHVKVYLASHTLRWSYPALSNRQVRWQYTAARLEPGQLAFEAAADGFGAILVDRYGYSDSGAAVTAAITARLGGGHVLADEGRYVALDIRTLRGSAVRSSILSSPPSPATTGMRMCPGEPLIGLDGIRESRQSPTGGILLISGSDALRVSGWAVDQQQGRPGWAVDVVLDGAPFPSLYGSDRADVAEHFKRPAYQASGFAAEIPMEALSKGQHTLTVRVVSADQQCFYEGARVRIAVE
jgi:phosphoglycerol transferase